MSVIHLLMKLGVGWVVLLGGQLDYLLLIGEGLLVLIHLLVLYRSRMLGRHSLYTRSFNIIGVPWFLLSGLGC